MKLLSPRLMIQMWMVGFAGSLIFQTVLQGWFADHSHWGANPGWQNEIAIWNVGMFLVLLGVVRSKLGAERHVLFGLFVLSLCFGANHGVALLQSSSNISNWLGCAFNAFGVIAYLIYVVGGRRDGQESDSGQP